MPRKTADLRRFGKLAEWLADSQVEEIFISGSGRAFLSITGEAQPMEWSVFDARQVAALARKLAEILEQPLHRACPEACGWLGADWHAVVLNSPLVDGGPVIRIERHPPPASLANLIEVGVVPDALGSLLEEAVRQNVSLVLVGEKGAPLRALWSSLSALAAESRRVAWFDVALASRSARERVCVTRTGGVRTALLAGADVIACAEPGTLWADLLLSGRPFLATFEAPTLEAGVGRLVADLLHARPGFAPEGAKGLVQASVGLLVEVDRTGVSALAEMIFDAGDLRVRRFGLGEGAAPGDLGLDRVARPVSDLATLRPEDLVSFTYSAALNHGSSSPPSVEFMPADIASSPVVDATLAISPVSRPRSGEGQLRARARSTIHESLSGPFAAGAEPVARERAPSEPAWSPLPVSLDAQGAGFDEVTPYSSLIDEDTGESDEGNAREESGATMILPGGARRPGLEPSEADVRDRRDRRRGTDEIDDPEDASETDSLSAEGNER